MIPVRASSPGGGRGGVGGAPSCQHPAPNPAVSLQGALGSGLVSPVSARTEVWAFGFRASWPCGDPREVLRRKPRLCGPGEQLEAGAALTSIKEGSRPCPLSLLCAPSGAWEGAELSGGRLRPTTLQTGGAVVGGRLTFPSPYPEHRSPPVSRTELPGPWSSLSKHSGNLRGAQDVPQLLPQGPRGQHGKQVGGSPRVRRASGWAGREARRGLGDGTRRLRVWLFDQVPGLRQPAEQGQPWSPGGAGVRATS